MQNLDFKKDTKAEGWVIWGKRWDQQEEGEGTREGYGSKCD
jgi:hypothetical protein